MLGLYGTDFRRMVGAEGLEDSTLDEFRHMYLDVLDMCYAKNTVCNQKKMDWLQIRDVYELENRYCFDVLVAGNGMNVCRRDFEQGGELGMLLKDYEFRLLEKLSIVRKIYKKMHDQGLTCDDLGMNAAMPDGCASLRSMMSTSAISKRASTDEIAEEGATKTRGIAIIVKNAQHNRPLESVEDEKSSGEHHTGTMNSGPVPYRSTDGGLEKHLDTPKGKSETNEWVRGDYSGILRLSRRY